MNKTRTFSNHSILCILGESEKTETGLDLSSKQYFFPESRISSRPSFSLEELSIPVVTDSHQCFHWSCLHHHRTKRRRTKVTDGKEERMCYWNEFEEYENLFRLKMLIWNTWIKDQHVIHTHHSLMNYESIPKSSVNIYDNKTIRSNASLSDGNLAQQSKVLGPNHLRKAKLMFFYTRYPSSSFLKLQFPDIKFEKTNTAQLVKWFSNFREFYYIQIEKFARQILSEGKCSDDHDILSHDDLYRILVTHYNRNNQIMVPVEFASVVRTTLEEFYFAIANGKDKDQSWKKIIYKKIARLDQEMPTFFKDPYWIAKTNANR